MQIFSRCFKAILHSYYRGDALLNRRQKHSPPAQARCPHASVPTPRLHLQRTRATDRMEHKGTKSILSRKISRTWDVRSASLGCTPRRSPEVRKRESRYPNLIQTIGLSHSSARSGTCALASRRGDQPSSPKVPPPPPRQRVLRHPLGRTLARLCGSRVRNRCRLGYAEATPQLPAGTGVARGAQPPRLQVTPAPALASHQHSEHPRPPPSPKPTRGGPRLGV